MLCSLAQHFGEDVTFIFRTLHHPVERLCHKGVDKTVASTKDPTYHIGVDKTVASTKDPTYHMSFP